MSTHLCILTTTYNRPAGLARLYASLAREAAACGVRLTRCLVDDASETPYAVASGAEQVHCLGLHRGREGYWETVTALWQLARTVQADLYCMVPDDMAFYPGGLATALAHWYAIADPRTVGLTLVVDQTRRYGPCWTGVQPRLCRFEDLAVYYTAWTDGAFLAPRRFFEALDWCVQPIDPCQWKAASSGVFAQVSHRLLAQRLSLYQLTRTVLAHGAEPSQMHPILRTTEVLHA